MRTALSAAALLLALLAAPVAATAQGVAPSHSHGDMSALPPPGAVLSTPAYEAATEKMHTAMMAQRFTGRPDADFAAGMLPHHQGAIDMAAVELHYGTDPEMRALAQGIVAAQQKEIGQLQAWLAAHPAGGEAASPATAAFAAAVAKMHRAMDVPITGNADCDFAQAMLPHHQGAIDMAGVELRDGTDPGMRALAQGIVAAQQKEIGQLQAWLAAHPAKDAPQ